MRTIGFVLTGVGLIWLMYAVRLDTSIPVSALSSRQVVNISLLSRRNTHLLLGALATLSGVLLIGLGSIRHESLNYQGRNANCPETGTAFPDPPCARDLDRDAYKIWLVSKYAIARHEVLGKYVCESRMFSSVEEALAHAHSIEIAPPKCIVFADNKVWCPQCKTLLGLDPEDLRDGRFVCPKCSVIAELDSDPPAASG